MKRLMHLIWFASTVYISLHFKLLMILTENNIPVSGGLLWLKISLKRGKNRSVTICIYPF